MLEFEIKTAAFIKKHSLLEKGDFVLAAVSGGPDSLALLHFLAKHKGEFGITVGALHVDHMLRGEESLEDLRFVRAFCEELGLIFRSASIDIREKMERDQKGMQETARTYRYAFFKEAMKELGANKLASGHHGDDQVETVLMRLTRGSSGKARAGIQIKRPFGSGMLIRPMLGVSREEIMEYCVHYQLEPRMDPSNDKPDYTRNRFRLEVLPFLKRENANVHEHVQRFSEEWSEDEKFLHTLAVNVMDRFCRFCENEIILDIPRFETVPLPLQRRGIHLILNYLYQRPVSDLAALHTDMIIKLIRGEKPSGKLDLPEGLKAVRSYNSCIFTFSVPGGDMEYRHELEPGGQVQLPNGKSLFFAMGQSQAWTDGEDVIVLKQADIRLPLIVRTRKPGDRMSIKGMNGTKKVKDIFIDAKIPLHERDVWPIVTDWTGTILWIPGLRKSCFDTPPTAGQDYYYLRYSNQTSPGGP
ncbi:MAG TPA: tRNA lysidine(34) synthetase TilS [Bacillaceae bacterium]